jgi:hypothetical protein
MQKQLSRFSLSLPVYSTQKLDERRYQSVGEIKGTCFSIGGGNFLTAGHVVRTIESEDLAPVIGVFDEIGYAQQAVPVSDTEVLPCDLSILKTEPITSAWSADYIVDLPWTDRHAGAFDDIYSLGYAYGLHETDERSSVIQRAFKGHIVADPIDFKLLGSSERPFHAYELSFSAPRGLSGSPLLTNWPTPEVLGVVIGNSKNPMLILDTEEREQNSGGLTRIQVYESLSLGIAVHGSEVFKSKSELLNMTIGEYLDARKLLRKRKKLILKE